MLNAGRREELHTPVMSTLMKVDDTVFGRSNKTPSGVVTDGSTGDRDSVVNSSSVAGSLLGRRHDVADFARESWYSVRIHTAL